MQISSVILIIKFLLTFRANGNVRGYEDFSFFFFAFYDLELFFGVCFKFNFANITFFGYLFFKFNFTNITLFRFIFINITLIRFQILHIQFQNNRSLRRLFLNLLYKAMHTFFAALCKDFHIRPLITHTSGNITGIGMTLYRWAKADPLHNSKYSDTDSHTLCLFFPEIAKCGKSYHSPL